MRRRLLAIGGAALVVVLVAAAWLLWPRGTNEVSKDDAIADFRDRDGADRVVRTSRITPRPGVYTYRATGEERVKLGPLPPEKRRLPKTVTATAVDGDGGCFELTVSLFEEHTEDTSYCVADDGSLTLGRHVKHQRIGALSPTATMTCDPAALVTAGTSESELACELVLEGGPASISASLAGTATTGAVEDRTVGGRKVEATPLTVLYQVTGDLEGTWSETLWLTTDRVPVLIERTLDLSGPATFSERSTLELVDLRPET